MSSPYRAEEEDDDDDDEDVVSGNEVKNARWRRLYEHKLESLLKEPSVDYRHSAEKLSILVKSGLLEFTDLTRNPERFFLAHRLLVRKGFEARTRVLHPVYRGI